MTGLGIVWRSLWHHRRIHAAVALGALAATAVLTGALLVGDSVRGSLRQLTLDRLGRIDEVLVGDHFFRGALAAELADESAFKEHYELAAGAIVFPAASVQTEGREGKRLAAGVQVLGIEPSFWQLSPAGIGSHRSPGSGEVVLNQPLADELSASVGDTVIIRFGKADQIPADSPLGRRTDRTASLAELKIIAIIPAEGLGRFGLQPSQLAPRNAYVALADVQAALEVPGKINMVLIGGREASRPAPPEASEALAASLKPRLEDYGLSLKHVRMIFGEGASAETIYDYFSLSSERLLLDEKAVSVATRALVSLSTENVLTYLANRMEKLPADGGAEGGESKAPVIPYSTIAAMESPIGGALADDEITLTSWAADDLKAAIGDRVRVSYFEPETIHGEEREEAAEFRVKAIVPLTEPQTGFTRHGPPSYKERPTVANDPDLTPEVKGITDQASIADWDAPFPFDYKLIRAADDTFWENHRTTPKAYMSLAAGQKLWGSRFGKVTSIRIPAAPGITAAAIEQRLLAEARKSKEHLGLEFIAIKRRGLEASSGTTPFDVLFLLLSMFIIAAALLLVWLLFRLGVEQRASELGLLAALGWPASKIRRLFVLEGSIVAACGAALGVLGGIAYAWLMLAGLRTWWIGAIASPFLMLHVTALSLAIGFAIGWLASVGTVWLSLRRLNRAIVRRLLNGEVISSTQSSERAASRGRSSWIAIFCFAGALALALYAAQLGGEAQAGALLGAGALMLTSLLLFLIARIRSAGHASTLLGGAPLSRLALRSAGRNVGRSAATIALVATAAFLIVAVSAFRMQPTDQGIGGFDLLAESSQPIYADLNAPEGRSELLADAADALAGSTVLALRLKEGDDASCRNLYQPAQPRVLGVTQPMIDYFDQPQLPAKFAWSASAAKSTEEGVNPWRLLSSAAAEGQSVPVVLDQNTAMYSLRLYGGIGEKFEFDYPGTGTIKFQVAGLLAGSVLQGNLLIGESNFERLFPQLSGYRFFLIRSAGDSAKTAAALEDRLSDEGFDCVDARARLADLLAVQNTYISTFQSLGALGLVLGTFGLAAVQLRSVFERRKELALFRAAGFRRGRLGSLVLLENLVLLLSGLAIGTLAALFAILPQMLLGSASVPFTDLIALLGAVLIVGLLTGLIAVRATLRAPLVAALRGE